MAEVPSRLPVLAATPGKVPRLSPSLETLIDKVLNPHPDLVGRDKPSGVPAFLRQEAAKALEGFRFLTRLADRRVIVEWLKEVNLGMAQPVALDEFLARSTRIAEVLSELPADVFNVATKHEAQIKFSWFPGVSELHAMLSHHARSLISRRSALEVLISAPAIDEAQRAALTAEDREAIWADFKSKIDPVLDDVRSRQLAVRRGKPKPNYLTREQLIATYAKQLQDTDPLMVARASARLSSLGVQEQSVRPAQTSRGAFPERDDVDGREPTPWSVPSDADEG